MFGHVLLYTTKSNSMRVAKYMGEQQVVILHDTDYNLNLLNLAMVNAL